MNYKILTILFMFVCANAHAGYFIFHSGETITGKRASCGAVCSNNPDALRVSEVVYSSTTRDLHRIVNDTVVNKTQAEIDADIQARADAQALPLLNRIEALDLTTKELIDALLDLNVIKEKDLKDKVKLKKGIQ